MCHFQIYALRVEFVRLAHSLPVNTARHVIIFGTLQNHELFCWNFYFLIEENEVQCVTISFALGKSFVGSIHF